MKTFNKIKGRLGEEVAAQYLRRSGYKILIKNYIGFNRKEIDIVAKDKNTICFIEVKSRTGIDFGEGSESINKRKMQSYRNAALGYLASNNINSDLRFDVVSIIFDRNKTVSDVKLIKNAF